MNPVERAAARPPWWRRLSPSEIIIYTTLSGLLLVVGLGIAAAFLFSTGSGHGASADDPWSDVTMDSCVDTAGSPKANLTVSNSTSRERNYVITVVFERGGVQVGSGVATVVDLRSGQTAETSAVGFGTNTSGSVRCRVSDVSRY